MLKDCFQWAWGFSSALTTWRSNQALTLKPKLVDQRRAVLNKYA